MWYNPVSCLKPGLFYLLDLLIGKLDANIQEKITKIGISFKFDENPGRIKMPFAGLKAKNFYLQDIHLAFLWCCSYATVALNSMYYDKAGLDEDVVTFADSPELMKVNLPLTWARSLVDQVILWPEGAACPDRPDSWSGDATNLFEACAAYIILHEIGHLVLHDVW